MELPAEGGPADRLQPVASSSFASGGAPRPPAHTTSRPADHDACSGTSAGSGSCSGARTRRDLAAGGEAPPGGAGGRRPQASSVSSKSATTWSRSSRRGRHRREVVLGLVDQASSSDSDPRVDAQRAPGRRPSLGHRRSTRSPPRVVPLPPWSSVHRPLPMLICHHAANAPVAAPGSRAAGRLSQSVHHVTESHHGPTGVVPTAAA